MASADDFVEFDGAVHLVRGEFTLCGDAFDIVATERELSHIGEWRPTKSRVVTCEKCAEIIHMCRGVRTSSS